MIKNFHKKEKLDRLSIVEIIGLKKTKLFEGKYKKMYFYWKEK